VGVGVGVGVGVTLGVGVCLDVAFIVEVILDVAFIVEVILDVAFIVGVWVIFLKVLVVQPATNKDVTTSNRTTIAVIDLNCIRFMQVVISSLTIPIPNEKYQLNRMC
jgi:hypothetical protein